MANWQKDGCAKKKKHTHKRLTKNVVIENECEHTDRTFIKTIK